MGIDVGLLSFEIALVGAAVALAGFSFKIVGRLNEVVAKLDSCIKRLDKNAERQEIIIGVLQAAQKEHEAQMSRLNDIWNELRRRNGHQRIREALER
ncbi:MAG: hypothetical protein F4X36_14050 [Gammaproteobacteria bacterium]|nr:hypothetical protein [Gammaproteobacteria bacterium]